jgi:Uma2 family endonuclease
MNAPFLTQAADGLPRRGFTNRDIARMVEMGLIDEDEKFELIQGEIVPMSPEFDRHGRARMRLSRVCMRALGDEWFVANDLSLFLADDIEFKPDLHVFPIHMTSEKVRGPDVALAVELSSTTQKRDLALKAPLYARHGVRELWVIDLDASTGLVFTKIENGVYAPGRAVAAGDALRPLAFPDVSLSIAELLARR